MGTFRNTTSHPSNLEEHISNQPSSSVSSRTPASAQDGSQTLTESTPLLNQNGQDSESWSRQLGQTVHRNKLRASDWWADFGYLCICNIVILLIIAVVVFVLYWSGYFYKCKIPENAEVLQFAQSINANRYRELYLQLDQGITGNIAISQSVDPNQNDILILGSMQASSPEMLKIMSHSLIFDWSRPRANSRIFIDQEAAQLEKSLKRNCTRVNLEIIFPLRLRNYDTIDVNSSFHGDVEINLKSVYLTDRLAVKAEQGNVAVKASVEREIEIESKTGKVEAELTATKSVVIMTRRDINLELTSRSSSLNARAVSTKGSTKTILTQPFFGHFELSSTFHEPELRGSKRFLKITHSDNITMEGYFSSSRQEPWYLPRVECGGSRVTLEVHN
ncbi:hypothetical protein B0O80DRAFT_451871 [Mortierella sp. GBAus27b]|nr:hypothetical protein B0O80DRAFT_451871 [Mortierella sp. GBAus27b]